MSSSKLKHQGLSSMSALEDSGEVEMMDVGESHGASESGNHDSGTEEIAKSDENNLDESDAPANSYVIRPHTSAESGETSAKRVETSAESGETSAKRVETSAEREEPLPDNNPTGTLAAQQPSSTVAALRSTSKHILSQEKPLTPSEQTTLDKDKARLKEVISDVSPGAAQQVLREMWRLFLFDGYNKEHISFIIRAGLKNANLAVLEKVLKDDAVFKEPFQHVASLKGGVIRKVIKKATVSELSEYLPVTLIDELVEQRIRHAPAKDLVRWLAAGNRLGYREDDTLDESDESVVPNLPSQLPVAQGQMNFGIPQPQRAVYQPILPPTRDAGPPPSYKDALLIEQEKNRASLDAAAFQAAEARRLQHKSSLGTRHAPPPEDLVCKVCNFRLPTIDGYNFHVTKRACESEKHTDGSWVCENCLSAFTGKQGLVYHNLNGVCRPSVPVASSRQAPAPKPATNSSTPYRSIQQAPPQKAPSAAILPPRPPILPPQSSQAKVPNTKMNTTITPNSAVAAAQRPLMHTPKMKQAETTGYRQSPSDLPPEKLAAMNRDIDEEDERYQEKIAGLPSNLSEAERAKRVESFKNANSTRKSQIRKSYGVSLRLREKDKKAKEAMNSGTDTPPPQGRLDEFRATTSFKGPVSSQNNGFAPVNNSASGPGPANGLTFSAAPSRYRLPPSNASQTVLNPNPNQPNMLTHAREGPSIQNANNNYGFGMLKLTQTSSISPMNYQQVQQTNKRRRTSEDTSSPGTGYNSPHLPATVPTHSTGLAMVSVEDAPAKYAKRAKPLHPAQQQDGPAAGATPSRNIAVVLPSLAGTGTKQSAYLIISSDDDDDDEIPAVVNSNGKRTSASANADSSSAEADKPLPSVESLNSGRMSFRAKRGGMH